MSSSAASIGSPCRPDSVSRYSAMSDRSRISAVSKFSSRPFANSLRSPNGAVNLRKTSEKPSRLSRALSAHSRPQGVA
jgi:hypothetical protein